MSAPASAMPEIGQIRRSMKRAIAPKNQEERFLRGRIASVKAMISARVTSAPEKPRAMIFLRSSMGRLQIPGNNAPSWLTSGKTALADFRKNRVAADACLAENPQMSPVMTLSRPPSRLDGYAPIARAIDFLVANAEGAPSLEGGAGVVGLSPAHFQRVFKEGAGVSPKRFLQFLAAGEARRTMDRGGSVMDAAFAAGLSGPSRLHDLFLVSEAMTPRAHRPKGEGEAIRYAEVDGPFGRTLIGATEKGVCWLSFTEPDGLARSLAEMKGDWPAATYREDPGFIEI